MSDNKTDTPRNSFIFLISFTVFALFIISSVMVAYFVWDISPSDERLKNEMEALKTNATIFGGIAVFINAFYAAKRWEAMDKSADAANKTAKAALQNAQAAQDKQITERFAKAIEQLGNEKIEVRLGAIYTLERIAKDSPQDRWTIMEVLTAFVRENAPLKKDEEKAENAKPLIQSDEIEQKPKLKTDIQAALTVIGRRKPENDSKHEWLDLRNIDIRGADLTKVEMQGANLMEANLQWAVFEEAKLQGAFFSRANLRRADLSEANLQNADFNRANLQKAYLMDANLQGACFEEANLEGADLDGANLEEAFLIGANLSEAENLGQEQIEEAIGDRTTILPENLQPPEHWKAQVSPF
ncbi:pentapeptide repeat-containing protein [uncultured Nostoc sp.]|uniref:pentapeptide repeat-containing protein n=1 Tax=uncultured Nostoc sp. TaxID=340711 RepID=UPI0026357436|nr:pentapeptide repeat-containing protein [uncultured Nostoc sp.]